MTGLNCSWFSNRSVAALSCIRPLTPIFFFVSIVGIDTDEIDSNAEEFEDESVEFFIKEEITEVEE